MIISNINHPELLEDDLLNSRQGIIRIPQCAPAGFHTPE